MRRQRKARLPDVSPPRLLVTDVNLCVCVCVDTMFRCLSEDQNWNVTVLVGTDIWHKIEDILRLKIWF